MPGIASEQFHENAVSVDAFMLRLEAIQNAQQHFRINVAIPEHAPKVFNANGMVKERSGIGYHRVHRGGHRGLREVVTMMAMLRPGLRG